MELWLNSNKSSEIAGDPLPQNADLQATRGYNSTEVQESSVSPETYGFKGYWTTSSPLMYQSVVLSVIDHELGLTTMARQIC